MPQCAELPDPRVFFEAAGLRLGGHDDLGAERLLRRAAELVVDQLEELVTLLDRVWSKYDELADKHDVQKMETVGATYMAVGGLHRDAL